MDLAYVDIGEVAAMAIGFGMFVILPIVGLLLSHQRKMAILVRQPDGTHLDQRLQMIQAQLDELRARTADQALIIDECQRQLRGGGRDLPPQRTQI